MVKCPHCGREYADKDMKNGLIPTHDWPSPCRQVCPGSEQIPRGIADMRPLWKDDPELKESEK